MYYKLFSRYRPLVKYIKNWPRYFIYKWRKSPVMLHFVLRKYNAPLCVPRESLPVFKEFFMGDEYQMSFLRRHLPAHAVVVDVGANIGLFPLRLLMEQPHLKIFSYEPFPNNYDILQKNITHNVFARENVIPYNQAVLGCSQKNLTIYYNRDQQFTDSASLIPGFANNKDMLAITATTLQEIMVANRLQRIDLLKLDCEGSEFSILYDSPEDLIRNIPFIVAEIHDLNDDRNNIQAIKTFFYKLGFQHQTRSVSDKIHMIWAWK